MILPTRRKEPWVGMASAEVHSPDDSASVSFVVFGPCVTGSWGVDFCNLMFRLFVKEAARAGRK